MKKAERRSQILDKARDVFAEKGYHAAKIDDIVAHAQVARGTFYLYFQDKRRIFEELVDGILQRISDAIVRIHVGDDLAPPLRQLRDNIRRVFEVGLSDPGMTKILLHDALGLDPDFDRKVHAFFGALEDMLAASLAEGQKLGIIRGGQRHVMGAMALGAVKEMLLQAVQDRIPASAEVLTDEAIRFVASGLLAPGIVVEAALAPPREEAQSRLSARASA